MPRYGLFQARFTEPYKIYAADRLTFLNGSFVLYSDETLPSTIIAAISLAPGERLEQMIENDPAVFEIGRTEQRPSA